MLDWLDLYKPVKAYLR